MASYQVKVVSDKEQEREITVKDENEKADEVQQVLSELDFGDKEDAIESLPAEEETSVEIRPDLLFGAASDLTLVVEQKRLYVHKHVLMQHSPVFTKMFSPDFKEGTANEDGIGTVDLPGKKYGAFVHFLHRLYSGQRSTDPVTDETLEDLVILADEYDVTFLLQKCKNYVASKLKSDLCMILSLEQALQYLCLSLLYGHVLPFRDHCLDLVQDYNFSDVENSEYFQRLSVEDRLQVLLRRNKRLEPLATAVPRIVNSTVRTSNSYNTSFHQENSINCTIVDNTYCRYCVQKKSKGHLNSIVDSLQSARQPCRCFGQPIQPAISFEQTSQIAEEATFFGRTLPQQGGFTLQQGGFTSQQGGFTSQQSAFMFGATRLF